MEDVHKPGNSNAKSWMVAGSGSALISALLVYPADMLKTRLIVQNAKPSLSHYSGIMHGFGKIWKAEGVFALYKGLLPTFLGRCSYDHGIEFCPQKSKQVHFSSCILSDLALESGFEI